MQPTMTNEEWECQDPDHEANLVDLASEAPQSWACARCGRRACPACESTTVICSGCWDAFAALLEKWLRGIRPEAHAAFLDAAELMLRLEAGRPFAGAPRVRR